MLSDLEISYDGDLIEKVRFKKGLSIRPLWSTLKGRDPDLMMMWVDRFDSLCPIASEWALAQALEESAGLKISTHMQFVRSIFAELNRLIYLSTYLANVVRGLGLMQSYQQMMILREQIFQKQEEVTGGRILPQVLKVGGVRRDLAIGDVRKVSESLKVWRVGWERWLSLILKDELLERRLENLLKISEKECRKYAIWGIIGKASGLCYDSRLHRPHGAYPHIEMNLNYDFPLNGDALSRFRVAIFETKLSLTLCEQLLNKTSTDLVSDKINYKLKKGIYSGNSESGKGPVTAVIDVNDAGIVEYLKLFTVGQRVWPHIENYFAGSRAEEFDLLYASLGLTSEESEI